MRIFLETCTALWSTRNGRLRVVDSGWSTRDDRLEVRRVDERERTEICELCKFEPNCAITHYHQLHVNAMIIQ